MAEKWAMVDNSFPTFRGDEKPTQQIAMLTDYMFILVEELKYQLANLDTENWNGTALKDFQTGTTADIAQQVSAVAARLALVAGDTATLTERVAALEKFREQIQGMEVSLVRLEEVNALQWAALDELAESLGELEGSLDELRTVLTPDGEGGIAIGSEGKDLHLRGNVYINGKLITGEELV